MIIESNAGEISGVRGDPDHPANRGRLCNKGQTLHLTATPLIRSTQRLTMPAWRPSRSAPPKVMDWPTMNQRLAQRLAELHAEHGAQAFGIYISGQLLTEDYHAFNKFARGVLGTNNIDSNSRLCMSSAVAGYKQSLGADAPPSCYEDLDLADCVFITGANPAWAHPILFRRLETAKQLRPKQKLIVVDPRRTETAELADLHLQILPGTDVILCHGLLHACIWEGWLDTSFITDHTLGFAELKALVQDLPPPEAARLCGIKVTDLLLAARWFAQSPATLSLYCQGLNQSSSGTAKNTALINLHLACGQIGRPGAGPFSLTGQPNAMGGREAGGMATLLPGHRDPTSAQDRAEVAALWGLPSLPEAPGKTAVDMFEAAARGEIKVMWIACTNPAQSMPDQAMVRRALARCELVILQEAFADTATAAFADVLLPASTWGEKDGTVTNSERCISRVRAAVEPPGEARADWRIVRDVGVAMLPLLKSRPAPTLLAAATPEALWLEHRAATAGRDLDITGLSYAVLDTLGPQQWPFPLSAKKGQARLYQDHRFATASGRAQFITLPYQGPHDRLNASYPLSLTTGRLRDQWHSMSRSALVPRLFGHAPQPALHMRAQDMSLRGLRTGDLVQICSRHGEMILPVLADDMLRPAQVYLPMHWGEEFVSGQNAEATSFSGVNALSNKAYCPSSHQPELKFAAVQVQAARLPWRLSAAVWCPPEQGPAMRAALRSLMKEFNFSQCLPVAAPSGVQEHAWRFDAASTQAPRAEVLQTLKTLLALKGAQVLRYADAQKGRSRHLALTLNGEETRLRALLLIGEQTGLHEQDAWAYLFDLWRLRSELSGLGVSLLSPRPQDQLGAPLASDRSPQVCNCLGVSEASICRTLTTLPGESTVRVQGLQSLLGCGSQCGSCLPALRRLEIKHPYLEEVQT